MSNQICRNCGHTTEGLYCSNCGQGNDVERLKWSTLANDFLSTFIGDGAIGERRTNIRYGFLQTILVTIIRPGQTVAEYLEGQRRKYFNPITLLLMLSGFYALVGTFFGFISEVPKPSDDMIGHFFNSIIAYLKSHPAMNYLLLLPFTALAYKWIFRKRSDLKYIEYMYIGIFAGIFILILLILRLPFESEQLSDYTQYALFAAQTAQCYFAVSVFRRLFNVSIKQGIWSQIKVMLISYSLFLISIMITVIAVLGIYFLIDPTAFDDPIEDSVSQPLQDAVQVTSDAFNNAVDSLKTK